MNSAINYLHAVIIVSTQQPHERTVAAAAAAPVVDKAPATAVSVCY